MNKSENDSVKNNDTGPNDITTFCSYVYKYVYVEEGAD